MAIASLTSTAATDSSFFRRPFMSTFLKLWSRVREMETSEVAITSTEAAKSLKTWKTWARKPCCPSMRVERITIIVMLRLLLSAMTRPRPESPPSSATIRVPGSSGAVEFRTLIGTLAVQAGITAAGWTTLAPKADSSAASSKVMSLTGFALGTTRGSVVMMPSTSFQIWISEASTAAPMTVAVRSEPSRPSVVMVPSLSWAM
mmetsp:Transcript_17243/g.51675  ORF Transcript_17243/g.51675 Transcript_17243/m.51675 type:complete len:203 (+) Transcript_17243:300-908(+)